MIDLDMEALARQLRQIAIAAGEIILDIYGSEFAVRAKDDRSPVTDADELAEKVILERLAEIAPGVPVLAEESVSRGDMPAHLGERFWLVDPLDGTKEFISRNGEFTVNIALIEDAMPCLGVVYAPAKRRLFLGGPGGATVENANPSGGWTSPRPISVRAAPEAGLTVVTSRSHRDGRTDDYLKGLNVAEVRFAGSSLKFCLIAAAEADLYPRLGRTMEWDTAAGQAVLLAAGGRVETLDGDPLRYGKGPVYDNPFFVALGGL